MTAVSAAGSPRLAGIVGPATGGMRLQPLGVLGYAIVLPILAFMVARWLATDESR